MTENLPADNGDKNDSDKNDGRNNGGRFLAIQNLYYQANDISEIRKLAEVDIVLAEKIVEQRDRESQRVTASYKFGLVCSVALLGMLLAAIVILLVFVGVVETIVAIAAIIALAVLVRVILTGEWSDTSWFGQVVALIIKKLGGQ